MKNSLVSLARRALTVQNPASDWRCFCSSPSFPPPPSNTKLFVAGLSWSVDEKSLKDAFSSFGDVTEAKLKLEETDVKLMNFANSHQTSFASFYSVFLPLKVDARSAKDAMDGKAFLGRPLRVSYALEKVRGGPIVVPRRSRSENSMSMSRKMKGGDGVGGYLIEDHGRSFGL
ncbi:Glycine-rich RNA-binding protein 4, mitochondrial [Vitis vinifera]|uniref:Glycine-rich RNA-binding protein 4, mitochondrial n=1 Tax=Vitis vinifera TaxID=29760 RepID=A0A438CJ73_VITVI|nr:Glycine-rich RNA-binding protein 4, mitochondrial [Vitis vinifera]